VSSPDVHLAVDLGTSSLKLLAARADGTFLGEYEQPLAVETPAPGWAEADPNAWWAAVQKGLAELEGVVGAGWEAAAVTGQMHGCVLLDESGAPVRPAVLWPDTRAWDQQPHWAGLPGGDQARLGGPFSPGMTGPVLAWLAAHEPGSLATAAAALLPKDIVRQRLTAAPGPTDRSDASATLLWDVVGGRWHDGLLASARIPASLLPAVVASDTVVGEWRGARVVAGGGDTAVSLLAVERAVGGWRPGDLVVNLGSGAQVIDPVAPPPSGTTAPGWHHYADCGTGYYAMVAVLNAGLALTWALDRLGLDWSAYAAHAIATEAGGNGTTFVPFVAAERGAMSPPDDRPPGWAGSDGVANRARAVAEAQMFLVRRAHDLLGTGMGRTFVVGGGARERWVRQLLADVLQREITRLDVRSAAALGALCLAAGPDFPVSVPATGVAPRRVPGLEEAYGAWHQACYGTDRPVSPSS
jgi:xylulokinase